MNALILILPIVIALTWARLVRPGWTKLEGTRIAIVPIPILARIRMHLVPRMLAIIVAVALAVLDLVPWKVLLVPLFSNVLLILLPVKYTLTNAGIRLGWTAFRRWTEFAAVRRAPGGARLIGVQRGKGLHVWLSGSRGDDEFIHFLRTTIRNAYKGDEAIVPVPANQQERTFAVENDHLSTGISA